MTLIDTSAIRDGKYILQHSKTESHFHNDPKLVEQSSASTTLEIGDLVYMDHSGIYRKASASSLETSYILGVVYEFLGPDIFYLKMSEGHIFYRHPLPPDWFAKLDGRVVENAPLYENIPAVLGYPIYLSDSVPGKTQPYPPISGTNIRLVGYRTEYGFYFKPEPYCDTGCANSGGPLPPPSPLKLPNPSIIDYPTTGEILPKSVWVNIYNPPHLPSGLGTWANRSVFLFRTDIIPVNTAQFKLQSYKWYSSPIIVAQGIVGRILLAVDQPENTVSIMIEYENPSLSRQYSWSIIKPDVNVGYIGYITEKKISNFIYTNYTVGYAYVKKWLYV